METQERIQTYQRGRGHERFERRIQHSINQRRAREAKRILAGLNRDE